MHWYDWLGGIASGIGLGSGVWAAGGKVLRKQIHSICTEVIADVKADVEAVKLKLASETGGNSNGLRQKLNAVAEDMAKMVGVVETLQKVLDK